MPYYPMTGGGTGEPWERYADWRPPMPSDEYMPGMAGGGSYSPREDETYFPLDMDPYRQGWSPPSVVIIVQGDRRRPSMPKAYPDYPEDPMSWRGTGPAGARPRAEPMMRGEPAGGWQEGLYPVTGNAGGYMPYEMEYGAPNMISESEYGAPPMPPNVSPAFQQTEQGPAMYPYTQDRGAWGARNGAPAMMPWSPPWGARR